MMKDEPQEADEIRKLLEEAYPDRYMGLLRQKQLRLLGMYDLGDRLNDNFGSSNGFGSVLSGAGIFKVFPRIIQPITATERPNEMLNKLRITMAQLRAGDIAPEFTNTEFEFYASARKDWWSQRSKGVDGYGGWKMHFDRAFMDFAALGIGVIRVGNCEYADGTRTGAVYVSPLDVITDPYAASPNESRFVAFASLMSLAEAELRFPDFDFESYLQTYSSDTSLLSKGVRVIEYYSLPTGDEGDVSYMAFARDIDGPVIEFGVNPFDTLPSESIVNFIPPGSQYPIGLVDMQAYDQMEIEQTELAIKEWTSRETQSLVFSDVLDIESWDRLENGENPRFIRGDAIKAAQLKASGLNPIEYLQRTGVNPDHYNRIQMRLRSMDEKSGIGSNSSGVEVKGGATATEINSINARQGAQSSFLSREFADGFENLAVKICQAAAKFDTAPFEVMFQNKSIKFNGQDKRLTSKALFKGPLMVVISNESLTTSDVNAKLDLELSRLFTLFQLNPNPKMLEKIYEKAGIKNPEQYIQAPQGLDPSQTGAQPQQGLDPSQTGAQPQQRVPAGP